MRRQVNFQEMGERLRDARKMLSLQQKQMAAALNIPASYLSEIESGKGNPGPDFFIKLADKYNISMDYLVLGMGDPFIKEGTGGKGKRKEFDFSGEITSLKELTRLMGTSVFFYNMMMATANRILLMEEGLIKTSIKKAAGQRVLKAKEDEKKNQRKGEIKMNKKFKKTMLQSVIALVLVFSLSNFVYSYLGYNWRECLNTPGCTCTFTPSSTIPTLKMYITMSAGYFLNSNSAYQAFLNRVELAELNGINLIEWKNIFNGAIDDMERAKKMYENFKIASAKLSYNDDMIVKLLNFDYDHFRNQNGLIKPIFEKVKAFLVNADINGLDSMVLFNMDTILNQLYTVKSILDKDLVPDVSILWRINQAYLEAHLFGQYMSEILKANL
jgi:transcriptional regulator with XRE-family HTH domain